MATWLEWLLARPIRLIVAVVVVVVMPLVLLGELSAVDTRERSRATEFQRTRDLATRASELMSAQVARLADQTSGVATKNVSLHEGTARRDRESLALLARDTRTVMGRDVARVSVLDVDGSVLAVDPFDERRTGSSEANRDYFVFTRDNPLHRYYVSSVFAPDPASAPRLVLSSSIRTVRGGNQTLVGVLIVEVDLGAIPEWLAPLLGGLDDAYVVDGRGRLVGRASQPRTEVADLRSLRDQRIVSDALTGRPSNGQGDDPLGRGHRLLATSPLTVAAPSLAGLTTFGEDWHWQVIAVRDAPAIDPEVERVLTQLGLARLGVVALLLLGSYALAATSSQVARQRRALAAANAELVRATRAKSDFLANMSHELRTPLNSIIGFSEVLLERMFGELNTKQADYVSDILSSGKHQLTLINDVLDLSKVEAGKIELNVHEFSLREAVTTVHRSVVPLAQGKRQRMLLVIDDSVGTARLDEARVRQILLNLLSNAVKYTPDGGSVTTHVRSSNDHIEIAVTDTGVGISPEHTETVFEEFERVGSGYSEAQQGTGLGLALARRFARLMGGDVVLVSQPERGSTFTVHLPLGGLPGRH